MSSIGGFAFVVWYPGVATFDALDQGWKSGLGFGRVVEQHRLEIAVGDLEGARLERKDGRNGRLGSGKGVCGSLF